MSASVEDRPEWHQTFTVQDQLAIQAMDEATRAIVERYRRATAWGIANELTDTAMSQGWTLNERTIEAGTQYMLAHTV